MIRRVLFLLLVVSFACEDPVVEKPIGTITTPLDVLYFPNSTIFLKGIFRDPTTLASVSVRWEAANIDHTFDLTANTPTIYNLDFPIRIPSELAVGKYQIEIEVTNKLEASELFYYDVDYVKLPWSEGLVLYYKGRVGDNVPLVGEIFDDIGLFRYRFICLGLDVVSDVRLGEIKEYKLRETFLVHPHISPGLYPMTFEITNYRKLTYQVTGLVEIEE